MATELRLFLDKNCTVINGTILKISENVKQNVSQTGNDATSDSGYDAEGAMKFIVATVIVYSILGVFCTLLTRFKRERGRGHLAYVQDEMVLKYIKNEKLLKIDGRRMKLMYDAQLMSERLKLFNEKNKLYQLERDLESDFSKQLVDTGTHHKHKKKKQHDLVSTVGKMGMSLFHVNTAQEYQPMINSPTASPIDDDSNKPNFSQHVAQEEMVLKQECDTKLFLETDV